MPIPSSGTGTGTTTTNPTTTTTTLPAKGVRDAAGIDTVERGLVAAALAYRFALSGTTISNCKIGLVNQPVLVEPPIQSPVIQIEARLLYNSTFAFKAGGDFGKNLLSTAKSTPFPLSQVAPATPNNPAPIPVEPSWVKSIESYLVWLAILLQGALPQSSNSLIEVLPIDGIQPFLAIRLFLPYDPLIYAQTGNLIAAVRQIVTSWPSGGGGGNPQTAPWVGNNFLVGNSNFLGN
jgi:hypothetical protein